VLFPDRWEAEAISKIPVGGTGKVSAAAERILELGVGSVVVTLGPEGVFVADGSRSEALSPIMPHGPLRDVTGAGDALVAGYLYALRTGHGEPIRLGLAAASLVLESGGSLAEGLSVDRLRERADEAA
jgi:sugar/nucleoside kinase (ribokinase family)